jgi:hypothetical protein
MGCMMTRNIAAILVLLTLCALSSGASAQCTAAGTTPGFTAGGNSFGRTSDQWNAYFGAKADANNGTLCNATVNGSVAATSETVGSPTGGNLGAGTLNAEQLFEQGVPVPLTAVGPAGGILSGTYPDPGASATALAAICTAAGVTCPASGATLAPQVSTNAAMIALSSSAANGLVVRRDGVYAQGDSPELLYQISSTACGSTNGILTEAMTDGGCATAILENGKVNVLDAGAVGSATSQGATCVTTSPAVTLAAAGDFRNGQPVRIDRCGAAYSATPASSLAVTANCFLATCATTRSYALVSADGSGGYSAASAIVTIANSAATLGRNADATANYDLITWTPGSGNMADYLFECNGTCTTSSTWTMIGERSDSETTCLTGGLSSPCYTNYGQTPTLAPYWMEFCSTVSACTLPTAAGNEWWLTSIESGAGTTSLTMSGNAPSSAAALSGTAWHDDSAAILAAKNTAQTIYFPLGSYPFVNAGDPACTATNPGYGSGCGFVLKTSGASVVCEATNGTLLLPQGWFGDGHEPTSGSPFWAGGGVFIAAQAQGGKLLQNCTVGAGGAIGPVFVNMGANMQIGPYAATNAYEVGFFGGNSNSGGACVPERVSVNGVSDLDVMGPYAYDLEGTSSSETGCAAGIGTQVIYFGRSINVGPVNRMTKGIRINGYVDSVFVSGLMEKAYDIIDVENTVNSPAPPAFVFQGPTQLGGEFGVQGYCFMAGTDIRLYNVHSHSASGQGPGVTDCGSGTGDGIYIGPSVSRVALSTVYSRDNYGRALYSAGTNVAVTGDATVGLDNYCTLAAGCSGGLNSYPDFEFAATSVNNTTGPQTIFDDTAINQGNPPYNVQVDLGAKNYKIYGSCGYFTNSCYSATPTPYGSVEMAGAPKQFATVFDSANFTYGRVANTPAVTNLVAKSQDFTNAAWTCTGITVTTAGGGVLAPDGTAIQTLTPSSASQNCNETIAIPPTGGGHSDVYLVSFWTNKNSSSATSAVIAALSGGTTVTGRLNINPQTGAALSQSGTTTTPYGAIPPPIAFPNGNVLYWFLVTDNNSGNSSISLQFLPGEATTNAADLWGASVVDITAQGLPQTGPMLYVEAP